MAETHKGFGLLFEMGCGKTLTAIMIAGTAYQMGKVEKVLVVAPTSVCSVWPKDFAEFADFKANIKVLLGDKNRRLKLLNDLDNFPFKALKVAVINYESTWREGIFDALYEWNADMIICDESQRIKSHDAEQSKAMHKLGDQAKYKLMFFVEAGAENPVAAGCVSAAISMLYLESADAAIPVGAFAG